MARVTVVQAREVDGVATASLVAVPAIFVFFIAALAVGCKDWSCY